MAETIETVLCYYDIFGEIEDLRKNRGKPEEKKEGGKTEEKKDDKKAPKIAKSSVILAIKPWDAETDMKVLEEKVREIKMDGLLIGASKLEDIGFGIKKLLVNFIVEDEVCSVDVLQESIQALEDLVQSTDIEVFNKVA